MIENGVLSHDCAQRSAGYDFENTPDKTEHTCKRTGFCRFTAWRRKPGDIPHTTPRQNRKVANPTRCLRLGLHQTLISHLFFPRPSKILQFVRSPYHNDGKSTTAHKNGLLALGVFRPRCLEYGAANARKYPSIQRIGASPEIGISRSHAGGESTSNRNGVDIRSR
jgi:hypothetical protein